MKTLAVLLDGAAEPEGRERQLDAGRNRFPQAQPTALRKACAIPSAAPLSQCETCVNAFTASV